MKLATLCYLKKDGKTLMLHRVKKKNDIHEGKYNGLGGKFEPGETPEQCVIREVYEECGLQIEKPKLHGFITFPEFANGEDWYVFVFTARNWTGELSEYSGEGNLCWIPDQELSNLPLWEGDHIFLPWISEDRLFSACFTYKNGFLAEYSVCFY